MGVSVSSLELAATQRLSYNSACGGDSEYNVVEWQVRKTNFFGLKSD